VFIESNSVTLLKHLHIPLLVYLHKPFETESPKSMPRQMPLPQAWRKQLFFALRIFQNNFFLFFKKLRINSQQLKESENSQKSGADHPTQEHSFFGNEPIGQDGAYHPPDWAHPIGLRQVI